MTVGEIAVSLTALGLLITVVTALLKATALLGSLRSEIEGLKAEVERLRPIESRLAQLELKTETIWEFLMRRAVSEAVEKGVAKVNSPIRVSTWAQDWFAAMREELADVLADLGPSATDADTALEIERRLGPRMLKEVCIPHQLWSGACMIIALAVAKEAYRERLGLTDAAKGSGVEGE